MTMNYYLGVKKIKDAANALDELSFFKVLDVSTMQVRITNDNRIYLRVGPASSDDDMSKGVMIWIGGSFTISEMNEIEKLARLADNSVTTMVAEFVAKQAIAMQSKGASASHRILGQP